MNASLPPDVVSVLRDGLPRTKTELAKLTGRARSTVSSRLAELAERGLVVQLDETAPTKGRPSAAYALNTHNRLIGALDLGAHHGVFAVTDLAGKVLAHQSELIDIADGPVQILDRATAALEALLDGLGRSPADLVGIGIGLPGPVEHETGLPISPPIMPGWDRFDLKTHIRQTFDVPVVVDNDVNVMAIGEMISAHADQQDILVIKVATGIGAGIIAGGHLVRGADGAAGDLGHVQVDAGQGRLCRCGQFGCCEAVASGAGVAQTLTQMGIQATGAMDVVRLVRGGHLEATRVVREAGRIIGQVLAACICLLNPAFIVIGGEMAQVGEPLLAGIREIVYQRSQPLATKHLRIVTALSDQCAGVIGASRLIQDLVFGLSEVQSDQRNGWSNRSSAPRRG
jgi:predicted NBD/HSP70 family sugar kinase